MTPDTLREQALVLWEQGVQRQKAEDVDAAEALYRQSLALHPTAEAHTFLGWVYSRRGDVERAIDECKRAIDVDPELGNPYNDIGAYLIDRNELDDAIVWLERAKQAARYDARHFPHVNLARIYARRGFVVRALGELAHARELAPGVLSIDRMIAELRQLN